MSVTDPDLRPQVDRQPRSARADWWRDAVVYQVYLRSFADSDGDGIGDLQGLRSRLSYLDRLGVDAIWLTPFYPSPLADGGYDISDHRNVDPRLGTLTDFDQLVSDAHALHLKVIVDIVPNHTSVAHPWFREALASAPGSAARDRYIFRNGRGPHGELPPSDWKSHFGGSAWQRVEDGQWYLHLFDTAQPDLNWQNQEIRQYFLDTLRFWADRGVDGFRVDVAHSLAKDLSEPLRSQPTLDRQLPMDGSDPLYDRNELHEIYRSWRKVFDEYDPPRMGVAELWTPTSSRTYLYARPDELGQVFDFSLLNAPWDRDRFVDVIRTSIADHAQDGGGLTWVLSTHDVPRHASRLALPSNVAPIDWVSSHGLRPLIDENLGRRRAHAATLMMLALPGSAYLFQGEELGLPEVADIPMDAVQDPIAHRTGGAVKGRDGCRVPLPWQAEGPSFGFGEQWAWLPQPAWLGRYAVQAQLTDGRSSLQLYRAALSLRHALQTSDTELEWLSQDIDGALHFRRANGWECLVNFSDEPIPLPAGEPVLRTDRTALGAGAPLPPDAAVWLWRP